MDKKLFTKKLFTSKSFRAGGYSAGAVALVILIAIAVNLFAGALPTSKTQLDFTENNIYSLSDQTKRIMSALDKDVSIYLIAQTGSEDTYISGLLERYKDLSSHISVTYIDPSEFPTFAKQYTSETVYTNSLIVECGDLSRYVSYYDIYQLVESEFYDTYYYYYYYYGYTQYYDLLYDWVFNGEQAVTSAISYVTSDDLPQITFLTGHGEMELSDSILSSITAENFTYTTVNLLTEEIPEDTDIVMLVAPENDINTDEADTLIEYIDNGGDVVIIANYVEGDSLENLNRVTGHMGMTLTEGIVIEGSQSNYYRYPYYLLPNIESTDITTALVSANSYILYPVAMGIEHSEEVGTYTALLTTSDEAFSKLAGYGMTTYSKEEGDLDGAFDLAAAVVDGQSHMVLFTSAQFVTDSTNQMVSGANVDLLLNSLAWMTDQTDKISIRTKSLETSTLTVSSADANMWAVIMIGAIPAGLILLGVAVMIWRKRR